MSAMTITDERLKAVAFSDPYFQQPSHSDSGGDSSIQTVEDLVGKKISVQMALPVTLQHPKSRRNVKRFNLAPDAIQKFETERPGMHNRPGSRG